MLQDEHAAVHDLRKNSYSQDNTGKKISHDHILRSHNFPRVGGDGTCYLYQTSENASGRKEQATHFPVDRGACLVTSCSEMMSKMVYNTGINI